jgi:3-deoxy-D-manno-octulosonic-acid transferase
MLQLYNTALWPARVALALWGAVRPPRGARRVEWEERRALKLPSAPPGAAWLHGASVGEARLVGEIAAGLHRRCPALPLVASACTATGRALLPAPPVVHSAFFMPLDFPGWAARLLGALRPAVLVLVETELWPNLLHASRQAGIPVLVINGRLSAARMPRYRRLRRLFQPLLRDLSVLGAQSPEDGARFAELGVPRERIVVTGNIKYDLPAPETDGAALRGKLGIGPRRAVFVAGSTGAGEEGIVLEAFALARADHADLLLILAPRHPQRAEGVASQIAARGLRGVRHSAGVPATDDVDVLLVDTLGSLASLYQLARVAFVGGSLVPIGGHNVLEPAAAGVPVLVGPHTENARDPTEALLAAGGARRVSDGADLGRAVSQILRDEALQAEMARRAQGVVAENRGALERSLDLVLAVVAPP